jgi:hypothetical protein
MTDRCMVDVIKESKVSQECGELVEQNADEPQGLKPGLVQESFGGGEAPCFHGGACSGGGSWTFARLRGRARASVCIACIHRSSVAQRKVFALLTKFRDPSLCSG